MGIPLVLVVLGIVEWSKRLGVSGKWLLVLSMLVGVVLGVLYQISLAIPTDFAAGLVRALWIGLGLVASGVYDAVRSAAGVG